MTTITFFSEAALDYYSTQVRDNFLCMNPEPEWEEFDALLSGAVVGKALTLPDSLAELAREVLDDCLAYRHDKDDDGEPFWEGGEDWDDTDIAIQPEG